MRLFVALELPDTAKDHLVGLQSGMPGARWLDREQMHLTLHFIGEVGDARAVATRRALEAVRAAAFAMILRGVGRFPPGGRGARVLWVGVDDNPALQRLHRQVGEALTATGYQPETHPFKPHITLARLKNPPPPGAVEHFLARHAGFLIEPIPVGQFVLYSSTLTPQGALYRREAPFPLVAS